ncbi:MAG: DUF447 family protein [Peptococcaceae bacterium]|nr:DUF447 family protein [Peptococcaceae bacterium]
MIIETIISSINDDGKVNFAPIGIYVPDNTQKLLDVKEMEIFLYPGSKTFNNLKATKIGVVNFTDDILSFVDTALFSFILPSLPSHMVLSPRMADANMIWEFMVTFFDDSTEPARVKCKILCAKEYAGFTGFCRAHCVILEAIIAATRLQFISATRIEKSWPLWQEVVNRTGGLREFQAFSKVTDYFIQNGIVLPIN